MILVRLTYFSRIRLDRLSLNNGIADIVSASAANNARDGITAALLHDDRWFAQVLEGAESVVSATFERILCDQRHGGVSLVTMQPVAERLYPDSAMIRVVRSEDNDDLFRHYSDEGGFDPREMRADRLADLIEEVVSRNAGGGPAWMTRSATNAA